MRSIDADRQARMKEGAKAKKAVRAYLEALAAIRPKRGRPKQKTAEEVDAELTQLRKEIAVADPMKKLDLLKKYDRVAAVRQEADIEEQARQQLDTLAGDFIQHAKTFADARGVTYGHWLEVNVPPEILEKAGIEKA